MYQRAERVADTVWAIVMEWNEFARDTVGRQLVRAVDSVGANIAEGAGRFHIKDVIRFCYYSRGSLRETRYWLKRVLKRQLISDETFTKLMNELATLGKELNAYIRSQRNRTIKETTPEYTTSSDNEQTNS
ncbi:four helix bundle protein [Chloroflexi bacterium TSY]|nr:four helix bundle protein [Chloroflexi bacterium TSY]